MDLSLYRACWRVEGDEQVRSDHAVSKSIRAHNGRCLKPARHDSSADRPTKDPGTTSEVVEEFPVLLEQADVELIDEIQHVSDVRVIQPDSFRPLSKGQCG